MIINKIFIWTCVFFMKGYWSSTPENIPTKKFSFLLQQQYLDSDDENIHIISESNKEKLMEIERNYLSQLSLPVSDSVSKEENKVSLEEKKSLIITSISPIKTHKKITIEKYENIKNLLDNLRKSSYTLFIIIFLSLIISSCSLPILLKLAIIGGLFTAILYLVEKIETFINQVICFGGKIKNINSMLWSLGPVFTMLLKLLWHNSNSRNIRSNSTGNEITSSNVPAAISYSSESFNENISQ